MSARISGSGLRKISDALARANRLRKKPVGKAQCYRETQRLLRGSRIEVGRHG